MANDIKIGNIGIGGVYIGSSSASSVYLGSTLVWSGGTTPPIPSSPKFYAEYSNSNTYSASCDTGNTTLTTGDTRPYPSINYPKSGMTLAEIGDCVETIGYGAFSGCSALTSIIIPNSVTAISHYAFSTCASITYLDVPDSVTSIGSFAFEECSGLTYIAIPDSVESIGISAFADCTSLTGITCLAVNPPTLGNYAFDYTNDCPIYVPAASVNAYQTAWSDYASRIQAIP